MARPKTYDKEKVLSECHQLFRNCGFSYTSMNNLAQSLGLSKSSIYNDFGSKSGLFIACLELECQQLSRAVDEIMESDGRSDTPVVADHIWAARLSDVSEFVVRAMLELRHTEQSLYQNLKDVFYQRCEMIFSKWSKALENIPELKDVAALERYLLRLMSNNCVELCIK